MVIVYIRVHRRSRGASSSYLQNISIEAFLSSLPCLVVVGAKTKLEPAPVIGCELDFHRHNIPGFELVHDNAFGELPVGKLVGFSGHVPRVAADATFPAIQAPLSL